MTQDKKQDLLRALPAITELLKSKNAEDWLKDYPPRLVTDCLRMSLDEFRKQVLQDLIQEPVAAEAILARAEALLLRATEPRVREAINATGIILHTGLGRAVIPGSVIDSMMGELKGYSTLAVDRDSGERAERDQLIEYILTELTGAEAATVVNNNAAATMLVLAGLAAQKEVIVSRGQLIEIGGSFRLPEVMEQSGARLVEVGATNRTHAKDYQKAITEDTAAILRAHPSNYRVVGFTSEVPLRELVSIAHNRNLLMIDDLGAGAIVDLKQFGLPHEPTVRESIEAGADIVLFSGDKLIGAGQCGVIVGKKACVDKLRKHPLMRALRVDKTCLMVLERTLQLFRDPAQLDSKHPTYLMLSASLEHLQARASTLALEIGKSAPKARIKTVPSHAYLGSGTLPTESINSYMVTVTLPGLTVSELAKRLRLDRACIFGRIEDDLLCLDVRTLTENQIPVIASAFNRIVAAL